MPVPIHRRRLKADVSVFTPRFVISRAMRQNSAIAIFEFDPPLGPDAQVSGVAWSPSRRAYFKYLPAVASVGTVTTEPISVPSSVREVTLRVLPWPRIMETETAVRSVSIIEHLPNEPDGPVPSHPTRQTDSFQEVPTQPWTASNLADLNTDERLEGLPIYYRETGRHENETDFLLVLMPAALSISRPDRTKAFVSRFTWADLWPSAEVLAIADPSLQESTQLNGGWFIHPSHDVPAAIAALAVEKADARGIPPERITFYGSSLGGFGAIAAASTVPGARAVAEVPQIYFRNWMPGAVNAVEKHLIRMPLDDFQALHPERLSLPDRLLHSGNVPSILLITNPDEARLDEQLEFLEWARSSGIPKSGPIETFGTDRVRGHKVNDKDLIRRLVAL